MEGSVPTRGTPERDREGAPRIVLTMIVRDEADTIAESLASIAPHIDRWSVVDTGSTDATVEVVQAFFAAQDIPGTMHERPWRDFATNRTEALELARPHGDYLWMFDADDLVVGTPDLGGLDADAYRVRFGGPLAFWRTQLFRADRPWVFEGAVHEHPRCTDGQPIVGRLRGDYHVVARSGGARSRDPGRFERDAALLLEEHERDPRDARTVFYLARSYHDGCRLEDAVRWYEHRIEMGGWDEEVFYAQLERARCLERLDAPWDEVVGAYLSCWQRRPQRAEPLYELARMCRLEGAHDLARLFAGTAAAIPFPEGEQHFVHGDVYEWRARDTLAIADFYTGHLVESRDLSLELLRGQDLPFGERPRVARNLRFSVDALIRGDRGTHDDTSPRFVIVGTGRSGTGFLARVLREVGVACGHEEHWNPFGRRTPGLVGDASWLAAPFLDELDEPIFHVVRHPVDVLRSLANGDMESSAPYLAVAAAHVDGLLDLPIVDRWAQFIIEWIDRCERHAARTWRLDEVDADVIVTIGAAAGVAVDADAAVAALRNLGTGVNAHRRGPPIGLADIADERRRTAFAALLPRFGWEPGADPDVGRP